MVGGCKEVSNVQRLLSYGLLSLITSTPIAGRGPAPSLVEDDEDEGESSRTRKGLMNDEGSWCWREECEGTKMLQVTGQTTYCCPSDCLKLTKALQKTAETLQSVADLHEDSV